MPDPALVPLQELEEHLAPPERLWGIPPLCLRASRQGGWMVLSKGTWGAEVEVKEIGK